MDLERLLDAAMASGAGGLELFGDGSTPSREHRGAAMEIGLGSLNERIDESEKGDAAAADLPGLDLELELEKMLEESLGLDSVQAPSQPGFMGDRKRTDAVPEKETKSVAANTQQSEGS